MKDIELVYYDTTADELICILIPYHAEESISAYFEAIERAKTDAAAKGWLDMGEL